MKTFLKVAATGSISKAAAVLFVTQSAVSRRIIQLENHLGTSLLDRTGPSLRLTEAGQVLAGKARRMLDIEQELFSCLSTRQQRQKISFSCTPSLGVDRLANVLSDFVAEHTNTVDFNGVYAMPEEALAGLDSGRFDLALIEHCDEVDLTGRITHALPDDEVVFMSAPSRGIEPGEVPLDRLLGERLYLKRENGCAKRFLDKNLHRMERACGEFASIVYFDDLSFIIREVVEGKGITFASVGANARELGEDQLRVHRASGFEHFRPRTLILADRELSALHHTFIKRLCAAFGVGLPLECRC